MSSPPICAQRRCQIRRCMVFGAQTTSLRRSPAFTGCARLSAHNQAGDVGLQVVAWIGSAVPGRRPYPRVADMPNRHRLRSARIKSTGGTESATCNNRRPNIACGWFQTLERPAQRCPRLPDCRYIPSSAETFLFYCFFFLTLALFLCLVYFPVDLEVFYLGHVKKSLYNTMQYSYRWRIRPVLRGGSDRASVCARLPLRRAPRRSSSRSESEQR